MTSFILKIIGIISMFCDHISYAIFGNFTFLNLIGRISFPIFAFQAVQGFLHTKNFKKYILRLFIFALISQIPFMLFLSMFSSNIFTLNIFFTFILGLLSIYLFTKVSNKTLGFLVVILIGILGQLINVDYGMYGVYLIFLFYIFRNKKILIIPGMIILTIAKYIPNLLFYYTLRTRIILCILFTCSALIPICFYNKKQGHKLKYLFYAFYPLHLALIYFMNFFIK